jgi:hypothetical protein
MNHSNSPSRLSIVAALALLVALGIAMSGQEAPLQKAASEQREAPARNEVLRQNIEDWILQGRGIPADWSHRHVVFSNPAVTEEEAFANGTHDHWLGIVNDPRYILQQIKRDPATRRLITEGMGLGTEENADLQTVDAQEAPESEESIGIGEPAKAQKAKEKTAKGIWGESLTSSTTAGTVGPGNYPAKYSFDGSVSCSDFVVFNTSLTGVQGSTTVIFTAAADTTGTIVITNSSTGASLTLTAGSANSGTTWNNNSATAATNAGNFNTILNTTGNGSSVGVYSTVSSATVTITAEQLGAVTISVKNNTLSNISTPASGASENFTGGTNAARILAYTDLYSTTCGTIGGAVPTLSWQYETGGVVKTSVSLSEDGTQLAFVQSYNTSSSTTAAELVLLTPGSSSTLSFPTIVTAANYRGCTAPCMTLFALTNDDTNSSPFVDYTDDILYVGDNAGSLHKFTGVFRGTPAVASSPWPVTVSAKKLTSPVYDSTTTNVFVADAGGFLYAYAASTGTAKGVSSQLAATGSTGIVDAPLVDSVADTVYVVVGQDGNTATSHNCDNATGCNGVFRFSTTSFITSGTGSGLCASSNGTSWTTGTNCGVESVFGVGTSSTILYDGTFDNAYYTSSGSSGNLWTCAATGTPAPKLINSSMSSFSSTLSLGNNAINPLASGAATCSPVTEILNGTIDYIYLSMTANGNQTAECSGACIYSFIVTSSVPSSATKGLSASGGSSGIIVDNTGPGGGSQIYFSYLSQATSSIKCSAPSGASSGGCVVQASQSGLN